MAQLTDTQMRGAVQSILRNYAEKNPGEIILPCDKHHQFPCSQCGVGL